MINTDTETTGGTATENTPHGRGAANAFSIAFDKIAAATAALPDDMRDAIRWAAGFCRARNLTVAAFAEMLRKPNGEIYSRDSVYHMFTGGREESALVSMVQAIDRVRRVEDARAEQVKVGFIETAVSRAVFKACRKAFLLRKVLFIFAESQIGKTMAAVEYARLHNHGETRYVRMPTGGGIALFLQALADVLGIPTANNTADLRRRIMACFDERTLLIIDEAHEGSIKALNFARELHDLRKCGVVFIATKVFRDRLRGPEARQLRQLALRGLAPLELPDRPGKSDLKKFATVYGLDEAPDQVMGIRVTELGADGEERTRQIQHNPAELQAEIIREHGLGRWHVILQEAAETAREKRRAMSWGLVLHAWHGFQQLSQIEEEAA